MFTSEKMKVRIRELVDNAGVSKTECAKRIGIAYTTLSNIYNHGRCKSIIVIAKIVLYFHVSVDYLIGRSDDKQIKRHRL